MCVCVDAEVMWRECSNPQGRMGRREHAGIPTLRRALRISVLTGVSFLSRFHQHASLCSFLDVLLYSVYIQNERHIFDRYIFFFIKKN